MFSRRQDVKAKHSQFKDLVLNYKDIFVMRFVPPPEEVVGRSHFILCPFPYAFSLRHYCVFWVCSVLSFQCSRFADKHLWLGLWAHQYFINLSLCSYLFNMSHHCQLGISAHVRASSAHKPKPTIEVALRGDAGCPKYVAIPFALLLSFLFLSGCPSLTLALPLSCAGHSYLRRAPCGRQRRGLVR